MGMFEESDWNDDTEARALTEAIFHRQAPSCVSKQSSQSRRSKRALLKTLRVLRAAGTAEESGAAQPELECGPSGEARLSKRKHRSPGVQEAAAKARREGLGTEAAAELRVGREESGQEAGGDGSNSVQGMRAGTLTRKQWRNWKKNQRRSKNKFRPLGAGNTEQVSVAASPGPEGVRCQVPTGKVKGQRGEGGSDTTAPQSQEMEVNGGAGGAVPWPPPGKAPGGEALEGDQLQGTLPRDRSSTLRDRMQRRLKAARFRLLNQQLYTTSSADAQQLFAQDPSAFHLYHHGFTAQLERWPENPVQRIIHYIKRRPRSAIVADFGCGDCKIARSVGNRVYSFDLVALNDLVTVCDMAKVPLSDASVDIVVFCLSLMGTNLLDFLMEANRVLRVGGILKIAEVASRFEDIRNFVNVLARLGFKLLSKDTENRYFYMFDFKKSRSPSEGSTLPQLQLKPCLYKKR
ncbi:ribosomal RNA-processing protein 8 isoform X2 [Hypanus sabinus]|nr:ribosomal RNA-processing protein 8 isoform X2 [Hypanus sabinus]XP_059819505.1 ribosomal RNA-processing protein 8 isoform X2 [Hypanus sabinus]